MTSQPAAPRVHSRESLALQRFYLDVYLYLLCVVVVVVVRACVFVWETCGPSAMRSDFFRFPGSRICRISGVQQLAAAATTPACTGYGSDRVDDISHQIGTSGEQKRKRNKKKKKNHVNKTGERRIRDSIPHLITVKKWTAKTNKENKPKKLTELLLLARFQENMFCFFFKIKQNNQKSGPAPLKVNNPWKITTITCSFRYFLRFLFREKKPGSFEQPSDASIPTYFSLPGDV